MEIPMNPYKGVAKGSQSGAHAGLGVRVVAAVCALTLAFGSCLAFAAGPTAVSGSISSNTSWTAADSPYVLSGDVPIIDGAMLSIQPGVTLLMNSDASLMVVAGSLSAQGTSDQPILITSVNDVPGSATPAGPGDWHSIQFLDGTIDASSKLDHVSIRFGHGIVIESSSPTLNDLDISDNAGSAISLDLNSSPTGQRLSASGNDLNGILVPAGVILGDMTWSLTGIPYVVAQGDLEVGLPPFGLAPTALQLLAGSEGQLTVNLPYLAPAGGLPVALQSSNALVATVANGMSVTVLEGQHVAVFTIAAIAAGSTTITATAPGNAPAQAQVTVLPLPALQFDPAAAVVGVGRTLELSVALASGVAANDVEVTLSGAGLDFVPNQTIPQGQASTSFQVTGSQIGPQSLSASSPGRPSAIAEITVEPVLMTAPDLAFVVPEAAPTIVDIALSHPVPAAGMSIAVANPRPEILSAQVNPVPGGATHVQIALTGIQESATPVDLVFSADGYQSASTSVTVQRINAHLGNGTQDIVIPRGTHLSLPVVLSKPAPAGGLTINAQSSFSEGLAIAAPASVTIAEGQTTSTSNLDFDAIQDGVAAVILSAQEAASIDGVARVTVTPLFDLQFDASSMIVGKGLQLPNDAIQLVCTVGEASCNFSYPLTIALSNSLPATAMVPGQVIIAAGNDRAGVSVRGLDLTDSQAQITAASPWSTSSNVLDISVIDPVLKVEGLGGSLQAVGASRRAVNMRWDVPGAEYPNQVAGDDQTISLSTDGVVSAVYSDVVAGSAITQITIPQGSASAPTIYAGSPQSAGTYRVHTAYAGQEWLSDVQTVAAPELVVDKQAIRLGEGLSATARVSLRVGDECQVPGTAIPVTLASSDPSVVQVPSGLTVDSCNASFELKALVQSPSPVTVTVSTAPGSMVGEVSIDLSVQVIPRAIRFVDLDGVRGLVPNPGPWPDGLDEFSISWDGDDTSHDSVYNDFEIVIVDIDPAGILYPDGIVYSPSGSLPYLGIGANQSNSGGGRWVEIPGGIGSYRLAAMQDGVQMGLSDLQVVSLDGPSTPRFDIQNTKIAVGKGALRQYNWISLDSPAPAGTIATLTSHGPDWATASPIQQAVPEGSTGFYFDVAGVETTNGLPIAFDVSINGFGSLANAFDVYVFDPEIVFSLERAQAVDGPSNSVGAYLLVNYPCTSGEVDPAGTENCSDSQMAAASMPLTLSIVDAGSPAVVQGLRDPVSGTWQDSAVFDLFGYSNSIEIGEPSRVGSYRIRATRSDSSFVDSNPVVVGVPQLTLGSNLIVGAGMRADDVMGLWQSVDGYAVASKTDKTVQVSCSPAICSSGAYLLGAGSTYVSIGVTGISAGLAQMQASASAATASVPVDVSVVEPQLSLSSVSAQLGVGDTDSFSVSLHVPGFDSDAPQVSATQRTVALDSVIPRVLGLPSSATISAGASSTSDITFSATQQGTGIIRASSPATRTGYSAPVTVNPN
jgi:trimeric autotransporter adhesin